MKYHLKVNRPENAAQLIKCPTTAYSAVVCVETHCW